MNSKSKLLLVGVFLLGCIASHVASTQFSVPPARAQTAPQRWEGVCDQPSGFENTTPMLNAYGAQGWEPVTVSHEGAGYYLVCFKRPL